MRKLAKEPVEEGWTRDEKRVFILSAFVPRVDRLMLEE